MKRSSQLLFCCLIFLPATFIFAQTSVSGRDWNAWKFLLGEWIGEGGGGPGLGSGSFSFSSDLQNTVIIRKNHAEYPASTDKPAYSHDDLMVIYHEQGTPAQAIYFDNEGHVIHYAAEFSIDSTSVTFLSDVIPSQPRFRLTYTKGKNGVLKISFDIAPPGKPQEFSPYIQATAHRNS